MVDLDQVKQLLERGDVTELARYLARTYPQGLVGERDALVTLFMQTGMEHAQAVRWASRLEKEGHAHHLPGTSPRWIFTSRPVSLAALARMVKGEWSAFVGASDEAVEEALEFFERQLGVDHATAQEIYRGLEAAGYVSVAYQEGPDYARDRVLFEFPEVFLKQV
ncbi:hypothetical protein [Oceanithermus desulfurans]